MMAVLWDDILADVVSVKRHFDQAAALYRTRSGDLADYVLVMAFQHAMQSGYTSFEAAMRRLLQMIGEPLPSGPDTHAALLRRLGRAVEGERPAVLDADLLACAEDLRRFRHVAMHAYDGFDLRRAAIPVESAEAFLLAIDAAITRFRAAVDPGA